MSDQNHDLDALLDQAASQIENSRPDEVQAEAAAARVWDRLSASSAGAAARAAEVDEIRGCDDYQTLIPAHLEGALPEARKMLLEDHLRECVPCRRALKTAREGEAPVKAWQAEAPAETPRIAYKKWALAAALIAGIGVAQFLVREVMPFGSSTSATVQTIDGDLFRIAATSHLPIKEGDTIAEGETVRTGREGSAVVRLEDGSLIEVRQRSELSIDEGRRGTTIELERGSVIVQAAEQRQRHLYVSTEDCLVSVTGTIFSVNAGTKGSRV
ncbi:MAG: FecR domain-containing protein, partial [Acidobacteriota bacterium]